MKNKLTKELVQKAIDATRAFIAHCENSDQRQNPQVVHMRTEAKGRLEAYEAVLLAMNGDALFLKIDAKEV